MQNPREYVPGREYRPCQRAASSLRPHGIDVWEVIGVAKTKPFGFHAFYPGPGLGGHCIPIDPFYLTWIARKYGMTMRFIELAGEINTAMPTYVVDRVADALSERGNAVKGSHIPGAFDANGR
jgi:UDP-N-acetyl-D-glucosamine dehydrogenase